MTIEKPITIAQIFVDAGLLLVKLWACIVLCHTICAHCVSLALCSFVACQGTVNGNSQFMSSTLASKV